MTLRKPSQSVRIRRKEMTRSHWAVLLEETSLASKPSQNLLAFLPQILEESSDKTGKISTVTPMSKERIPRASRQVIGMTPEGLKKNMFLTKEEEMVSKTKTRENQVIGKTGAEDSKDHSLNKRMRNQGNCRERASERIPDSVTKTEVIMTKVNALVEEVEEAQEEVLTAKNHAVITTRAQTARIETTKTNADSKVAVVEVEEAAHTEVPLEGALINMKEKTEKKEETLTIEMASQEAAEVQAEAEVTEASLEEAAITDSEETFPK